MIDHISLAVRDLAKAERFYTRVLAPLGLTKLREVPPPYPAPHAGEGRVGALGFGKRYPEFWINLRHAMEHLADDSGVHICLRADTAAAVDAFHAAALTAGGTSDGAPGLRPQYHSDYYAAFVRDPDGNRIEAVTFLRHDR